MVMELDLLKRKVNNMLIEPDWLNMLLDRNENRVTSRKMAKFDFAAAFLDARYCCLY
jgi:hypothetical protein